VGGRESNFVPKLAGLTFEQAAAVPVAGFTALQALRDRAQVRSGQQVLINGAAGGVGTFAVQIAKAFGAEVTAVCSTRNVAMVRSLGADHVLKEFIEAGKVTPVIDRTYPLSETPAAMRYASGGHARGKVVITIPGTDR